jgi:aryl-alcohol dehydrogenase-like predicted oxidoreductase
MTSHTFDPGPLALGTFTFADPVPEAESAAMVDLALDAGVTHFDTSINYGGGEAEIFLGNALRGKRGDVTIATKVFQVWGDEPDQRGLAPAAVHRAIDVSLERLGTDHVDVYYMHMPDRSVPIVETLGAMSELVAAGKVLNVGISNFAAWQVVDAVRTAEREGLAVPVVAQPQYNLLSRRLEEEYAECTQAFSIANVIYNPLAGGFLTGRHVEAPPPDAGRFRRGNYRDRYWNTAMFDAIGRLGVIADAAGLSLLQLALRWVLHAPATTSVLLGASSFEQLQQNLAAADGGPLGEEVNAACDDVWADLRGAAPGYNR